MLRFTRSALLCATLAAFPAAAETPKFGPELQGFTTLTRCSSSASPRRGRC